MRYLLAFVAILSVSCHPSLPNADIDPARSKKLGDPSQGGPSVEQQLPLTFEHDRSDRLSFPTFPAGEARFRVDDEPGGAEPGSRIKPIRCEGDHQCQEPDRCLRPAGSPGFGGVCGRAFGANGQDDDQVRYVKSCKEQWECPDTFTCVRVNGPWGLCVNLTR